MWYLRSDGTYPDYIGWVMLGLCAVVTVGGYTTISGQRMPQVILQEDGSSSEEQWQVNAWQVWYFGWLTAVSTGKEGGVVERIRIVHNTLCAYVH